WDGDAYAERARAFGWEAVQIDGHNLEEIDSAFAMAEHGRDTPLLIVARTIKGKGYPPIENKEGWHGRALDQERAKDALAELGGEGQLPVKPRPPEDLPPAPEVAKPVELPRYEVGSKVATRKVYGEALRALGARPEVVALDGEVSNSTYAEDFARAYPERFFEMWIAEQQMVAAAVGMSVVRKVPFASTFAAFFTRAY